MLKDPFGVAVGGTLGHCLCTGLAVIGGRMVAQKISVRTGIRNITFILFTNVLFYVCDNNMFFFSYLQLQ